MTAAQRGDRAAYVDLVRPRSDRLFAVAQRILRDVDRAEDALQDALVIAWRDLRGLRDPDRFDAWLHRLLVHVCAAGRYTALFDKWTLAITLPTGWSLTDRFYNNFGLSNGSADPSGDGMHIWYDMRIASRDADCPESPQPGVGHDSTALIADIVANPGLTVSEPRAVTVGRLKGQTVDVALAPDWTNACSISGGTPTVPLITDVQPGTGAFWGVEGANRIHLIALDVGDGSNVVITVDSADGSTLDEMVSATTPILDTLDVQAAP